MVPLLYVVIASLCGLVVPAPAPEEKEKYYTTKYDHVDIEMILNNRRLVNYYMACMLNKGPCPPDGAEFKRILPDALRTNCKKCTEKQKVTTLRAVKRLMKEYPKVWAQLQAEWDPDDVYVKRFINTYNNGEYNPPEPQKPIIVESQKPITDEPPNPIDVFNRFGDEDDDSQPPVKKPQQTLTDNKATESVTKSTVVKYNGESSSSTLGIFLPPIPTLPPVPNEFNPIANTIGQGIKATVSIGSNIVGQVIKGIGDIGNRVVETGAGIVGAIRNIARPLQRF